MKPFNLKEAKAGKPVCTRNGNPVRIICFDALSDNYPIIGLIKRIDYEELTTFTIDGHLNLNEQSGYDLMMATVKKEGYIALIDISDVRNENAIMGATNVYSSEEECHKGFSNVKGYIKTIKIEWEE